jgi:hypothetical protein
MHPRSPRSDPRRSPPDIVITQRSPGLAHALPGGFRDGTFGCADSSAFAWSYRSFAGRMVDGSSAPAELSLIDQSRGRRADSFHSFPWEADCETAAAPMFSR